MSNPNLKPATLLKTPVYTSYQEYKPTADDQRQPTTPDIEGPFYKANAPLIKDNKLTDNPGMALHGKIVDINGKLISGVTLDWWQADQNGVYDNQDFKLRGKQQVDGVYYLATIHPGNYAIDANDIRCAHFHVKVTAKGYKSLTTQLYFLDDKYDKTDHWFNPSRCIEHDGSFDFVLAEE